jgi:hypothetical protein
MKLSDAETSLLRLLKDVHKGGAFAVACDGPNRAVAYSLERRKLAKWKGTTYGSSFWAITEEGLKHEHMLPSEAPPSSDEI